LATNTERVRRHRERHGRRDRTPSPEVARLKAEGKTQSGWLIDDGIVDTVAIEIAISGERTPALTHMEAMLVAKKLTELAREQKHVCASQLVADRLHIERKRAESLMSLVRDKKMRGEL
jgi:hypothetical protein